MMTIKTALAFPGAIAEPSDDGSGWGGDGNGPVQTTQILNHLPPCLSQVYVSTLNAIAQYAAQTSATGFPSSFLPLSYFTGPTHTWELHAGPLPVNWVGSTHFNYVINQMVTTLDDQQLRNATDLIVMGLILHESVHAYLVAYYESDHSKFGMDYPDLEWSLS